MGIGRLCTCLHTKGLSRLRRKAAPAPPTVDPPQRTSVSPSPRTNLVRRATTLWLSALAFSLDAFDVEYPASTKFFQTPDSAVHLWVSSHIPQVWRDVFFGDVLSNLFIIGPLVAWWQLDQARSSEGVEPLPHPPAISSGDFVGTGSGATLLMLLFKQVIFPRDRPCSDVGSLSFPSGHAMEAVMLTSMFLLQIEVACKEAEGNVSKNWVLQLNSVSSFVVVLAAVTTAVGRIGSDVHWLSDTIAGAAMGLCATSLLANIHRWRRAKAEGQ